MRKIKIRAGLYLTACAGYVWLAALLNLLEIYLPAYFALIVGLVCGYACMHCGVELERERRKELGRQQDEWDEMAAGVRRSRCKNCGYEGFRIIAGRMICNCCGEVMDHDA